MVVAELFARFVQPHALTHALSNRVLGRGKAPVERQSAEVRASIGVTGQNASLDEFLKSIAR